MFKNTHYNVMKSLLIYLIKENVSTDTDLNTEEFIISFTSSLTEALEALSVSLSSLNSILLFHNDYKTGMYNVY